MSALAVILMLALVGVVVLVVSGPLRAARRTGGFWSPGSPPSMSGDGLGLRAVLERDDLEAEREAKYREIRDADLDYRTGKLSRGDFEAIDSALRAEAIEILNRLQESEPDGERDRDPRGPGGAAG